MTTATDHAIFVRREYRYVDAIDNTVLARSPAAIPIQLSSNMDEANAQALANKYLALMNQPRAFEITIDGRQSYSDFIGGPPSFIVDGGGPTARVQYALDVDYENNTSVIRVIG